LVVKPDPDYPRTQTLVRHAASAGFRLKRQVGHWFSYTVVFEKG